MILEGMQVSVVMPVFNAERFLAEAMESVLAQSFEDFEAIAVDDGSTDGSAGILERYARRDGRLRVFQRGHQRLPAALNFGCARAEGRYIARMDADDIAMPERLERQVKFLEAHPRVAILGTQIERIRQDGARMNVERVPLEHAEIEANMQRICCLFHPTVMMRAEAVRELGGYREAFFGAEDHDLWLRAAERYELANLPDVLLKYRLHTGALSFEKLEQQVMAATAAELSAARRRAGQDDPFGGNKPVTRQDLRAAGIGDDRLDSSIRKARDWYRQREIRST
ncbi:MAG: glycosyltransferase [Acidobacteriaceae bacterium]|nr:glycosyltransferase [Acidobacteriaceae bacterium]